ncbi:hypothetical protein EDEG_04254, partial [Edhazardia aedis USNM 41457]
PEDNHNSADGLPVHGRMWQSDSTDNNVGAVAGSSIKKELFRTVLRRGLDKEAVLTEMFLIECDVEFDNLNMKGKLAKVARCGNSDFRNYMVSLGICNAIPSNYEILKQKVVDFCTGRDLSNVIKYSDELWSSFISRLQDTARKNGMDDSEVIRRLREMWMPERYQILVHNVNPDLNEIIERITTWEKVYSK